MRLWWVKLTRRPRCHSSRTSKLLLPRPPLLLLLYLGAREYVCWPEQCPLYVSHEMMTTQQGHWIPIGTYEKNTVSREWNTHIYTGRGGNTNKGSNAEKDLGRNDPTGPGPLRRWLMLINIINTGDHSSSKYNQILLRSKSRKMHMIPGSFSCVPS